MIAVPQKDLNAFPGHFLFFDLLFQRPRCVARGRESWLRAQLQQLKQQQVENRRKEDNAKAKQATVLAAELPAVQTVAKGHPRKLQ